MEYIELGVEKWEKKFQNNATGIYTKDFFFEAGRILLQLAKRHQTAFMIAVVDVDNFNLLKEKHGSKIAYKILRLTAKIIGDQFRTSDIVADMEDGQIGVIFYNTSNVNAKIALEGLRKMVEESEYILNEEKIDVTVSIGASVMHNIMSARSVETLYEQAKIGVEIARSKGKNYVVVD
jgi:diguanylate cyclase (GGDEF)-like protein